jgi:hypothetical protein
MNAYQAAIDAIAELVISIHDNIIQDIAAPVMDGDVKGSQSGVEGAPA